MRIRSLFTIGLVLAAATTASARILVHAGWLIDGKTDEALAERTIVVDQGRFVEIREGYLAAGADDEIIDLSDHAVLPGLMDMHTHLAGEMSKNSYLEEFRLAPTDYSMRAVAHARRTLRAGFTTVRDLGDDGSVVRALRDGIRDGYVTGPRIFTAGKSLATTGGHADPTNGWGPSIQGDPGPKEGVVNGPAEARKAVRQRYKDGADLIKLTATGGVLSLAKSGQNPQFTEKELEAIVQTAADYGFTVAVHAHGAEGMKRAVLAGVNSIEHGTYMTEEVMELMKKHGTYYVPTILAGVFVGEKAELDDYFPEIVRPKAAAIGPQISETFRKAYAAGVKIAFGTDSGVSAHGENAREFALMVEGGMPPMKAIQSATMEGAKLMRIEDRLGSVEAGKIADLVAVRGNPLDDIHLMENVDFVMKDGVVYYRPE